MENIIILIEYSELPTEKGLIVAKNNKKTITLTFMFFVRIRWSKEKRHNQILHLLKLRVRNFLYNFSNFDNLLMSRKCVVN